MLISPEAFGLICNGMKGDNMRRSHLSPCLLVVLMITALIPIQVSSSDSTISTNTTWSGDIILYGNVTVEYGSTLTIEPGTSIDGRDGFRIEVEGELFTDGAYFYSSATPASQTSHGAGLWQGLVVTSTGYVELNNTVIENSNVGVKSEGNVVLDNLTVNDSYLGLNNMGIATVANFSTDSIDYEAIKNSGNIVVQDANLSNAAIGMFSTGVAEISYSNFLNVGLGISSDSGYLIANNLTMDTVTVGFAGKQGADISVSNIVGQNISLLTDMADSDSFSLSDVVMSGAQIAKSNGASATILNNIEFTASMTSQNPVIEQRCEGICTIEGITIESSDRGILLTGNGDHIVRDSAINSSVYGMRASGEGELVIENSTFTASKDGIIVRDTNSNFLGEVIVNTLTTQSTAIDIIGGEHTWSKVIVAKQYDSQDTSSLGVSIWYATVFADELQIKNHSTGIQIQDSQLHSQTISAIGGAISGINIISSEAEIRNLETKFQQTGVSMTKSSHLTSYDWDAELHDTPLLVHNSSTAYVLDFDTKNTNPSFSDASGDGSLYYGGSSNLVVSTDTNGYFEQTIVEITDMTYNPVQAAITVNTFQFTSDQNGEVLIPLLTQGSVVSASLFGTGTTKILFGAVTGQSIQIPVIPNGDWVIQAGETITLAASTGQQLLNGNLIMHGDATLILENTKLTLSNGHNITLNDDSTILGGAATIEAGNISINNQAVISSIDLQSLITLDSDIIWNCESLNQVTNVQIIQNLSLLAGCDLVISNGVIHGSITISPTSSLNTTSTLQISVKDRGMPVDNASITFQSSIYTTDEQGELIINSVSRYIDSTQDYVGGIENVLLSLGNFNQLISWDTSTSKSHEFMVSLIDINDILSNDVTLEAIWSPYYLEDDLTIPLGRTFSIDDSVSLRISDEVEILVEGILRAGATTFSSTGFGDRWGGFVLGDSPYSEIQLTESAVLEASPAVSIKSGGQFFAEGVSFARSLTTQPLIEVYPGSNATISLTNSHFSDAGTACIDVGQSQSKLIISDVQMERCGGPALRADNVEIEIDNISVGAGSSNGLVLSAVTGAIDGLSGLDFDGQDNFLKMDYIDDELIIENVICKVGGSAAISGANNKNLNLKSIDITGAPAIDFDFSAGLISDVILRGEGVGTGLISHHGRYSNNLELRNLNVTDYNVGIDLHADNPLSVSTLEIYDSVISSSTAISIEDYPLLVSETQITGSIESSGNTTLRLYDVELDDVEDLSLWEGAEAEIFTSIRLNSVFEGEIKSGNYKINLEYLDSTSTFIEVNGKSIPVFIKISSMDSESIYSTNLEQITISATSEGHPESIQILDFETLSVTSVVEFVLESNTPPILTVIFPESTDVIMQKVSFTAQISVNDDYDSVVEMSFIWSIFDDNGVLIYNTTTDNTSHDMIIDTPGSHILRFSVIDSLGAKTESTIPIEVKLLDSDGDFGQTCDENNWFDLTISRSCGPDVYDEDDDNDGFIDSRDEWPTDPCAWKDTDGDGQPDSLNCPEGVSTDLFEDQDDDGDGTPDILEGDSDSSSGEFNSLTAILLVVGIIVVLSFLSRLRKGSQG